jgi:hypothetical protein
MSNAEEQERLAWIMPVLRGNGTLWHRTSVESLASILEHGAIEPNDGRFTETYPQSRVSYGKMISAVCVYDFDSAPLDEIYEHAWKWASFLKDQDPATVLIGIDCWRLNPDNVRPPGTVRLDTRDDKLVCIEADGTVRPYAMYIPAVEAWHIGPISTVHFREYLVIRRGASDEQSISALPVTPVRADSISASKRDSVNVYGKADRKSAVVAVTEPGLREMSVGKSYARTQRRRLVLECPAPGGRAFRERAALFRLYPRG